jgi:hypothetical protein
MPYNRKKIYYVEGEWGGKECTKCGWFRYYWEFNKKKGGVFGRHAHCNRCRSLYNKKIYLSDTENRIKKQKEYRIIKKTEISEYKKQYYLDNKEKTIESRREYGRYYLNLQALYKTYGPKLTIEEDARETDTGYLEVRCALCNKYFIPTNQQVRNRINALNGKQAGESKIYCSEKCKELCPTYNQTVHPKGVISPNTIKRSFPADFRNMVLERDNHQCVICGSTDNLTVHHSDPFATCKMFENDMDGAFTLCEEHDKKAHSISGCTLPELRKASQEMIKELQEKGIDLNEVPEWALDKYLKK